MGIVPQSLPNLLLFAEIILYSQSFVLQSQFRCQLAWRRTVPLLRHPAKMSSPQWALLDCLPWFWEGSSPYFWVQPGEKVSCFVDWAGNVYCCAVYGVYGRLELCTGKYFWSQRHQRIGFLLWLDFLVWSIFNCEGITSAWSLRQTSRPVVSLDEAALVLCRMHIWTLCFLK